MKNRTLLREVIMKVLYQVFILEESGVDFNKEDLIKEQLEVENDFVKSCIDGVEEHYDEIVGMANKYLKDWDIKRLDKAGAAILRLAIYELKYMEKSRKHYRCLHPQTSH